MSDTTPTPEQPAAPQPGYGQQPPAAPPGYQAPPPGYGQQPPAGYQAPPPGYGQQPPPGYAAPLPVAASEENTWSLLSHVGGILTNFVAPLIIFMIYKDRSQMISDHSKEALNFQITIAIGYVVAMITLFIGIGVIIYLAVGALSIVFGIIAAIAANKRQAYRYPISIRFVK